MSTVLRMALATLAFGLVHSALASRAAKHMAGRALGERRRDGGYRLFYVVQSCAAFGALLAWGARQPARTVWRLHGPGAVLARAGQVAGAVQLLAGLREIGPLRWAGIDHLRAWQHGEPMPPALGAQGPERRPDGSLTTGGPFRHSRHPLNFAALPLFWCTPHLTSRRLGFNLAATVYLVLGSLHEENRLRALHGDDYRAWAGRVPFFVPGLPTGGRLAWRG